jgi:hypothetical protein
MEKLNKDLETRVQAALRSLAIDKAEVITQAGSLHVQVRSRGTSYLRGWEVMDACYWSSYCTVWTRKTPDSHTKRLYTAFENCWSPLRSLADTDSISGSGAELNESHLFVINQLGVVLDPTGDIREMLEFVKSYGAELLINQKIYFRTPLAASFCASGNPLEVDGPLREFWELKGDPLIVAPGSTWRVNIEGHPLNIKPFTLWVMLCGIKFRPVQ